MRGGSSFFPFNYALPAAPASGVPIKKRESWLAGGSFCGANARRGVGRRITRSNLEPAARRVQGNIYKGTTFLPIPLNLVSNASYL